MFEISGSQHYPYLKIIRKIGESSDNQLSEEMSSLIVNLIWNELNTMLELGHISIENPDEDTLSSTCALVYHKMFSPEESGKLTLKNDLHKEYSEITDNLEALFFLISIIRKHIAELTD